LRWASLIDLILAAPRRAGAAIDQPVGVSPGTCATRQIRMVARGARMHKNTVGRSRWAMLTVPRGCELGEFVGR